MLYRILIVFFTVLCSFSSNDELNTVRTTFEKAKDNKEYAEKLKTQTESKEKAILKAYHGTAWAFLAKHNSNPYKKLEYVKKGLEFLNSAVLSDAADIEIRFLRFAVEENIPVIVSFTSHIEADKSMLLSNLKPTHSYYATIKGYLLKSTKLSQEEKDKL